MTEHPKKKRLLITTSIQGVERAEQILKLRGIASRNVFAKVNFLSKSSVDKFFNHQPIQVNTFLKICEGLEVQDWRELAELEG